MNVSEQEKRLYFYLILHRLSNNSVSSIDIASNISIDYSQLKNQAHFTNPKKRVFDSIFFSFQDEELSSNQIHLFDQSTSFDELFANIEVNISTFRNLQSFSVYSYSTNPYIFTTDRRFCSVYILPLFYLCVSLYSSCKKHIKSSQIFCILTIFFAGLSTNPISLILNSFGINHLTVYLFGLFTVIYRINNIFFLTNIERKSKFKDLQNLYYLKMIFYSSICIIYGYFEVLSAEKRIWIPNSSDNTDSIINSIVLFFHILFISFQIFYSFESLYVMKSSSKNSYIYVIIMFFIPSIFAIMTHYFAKTSYYYFPHLIYKASFYVSISIIGFLHYPVQQIGYNMI